MVRVSVTAHTSNPHTRWAYGRADGRFLGWCEDHNLGLADVAPIDAGRFHTFRLALFKLQAVINTTTGQFHSDIDRYYAHSGVGAWATVLLKSRLRGSRDRSFGYSERCFDRHAYINFDIGVPCVPGRRVGSDAERQR